MNALWRLFRSLILRPLRRHPLRSLLTVLAVALGVAVVVAIDLAGRAATESFRASLASLVGKTDIEILANGGIDERWIGRLSQLPVNARFEPAISVTEEVQPVGFVTIYGVDTVAETPESAPPSNCGDSSPALVTRRLARRLGRFFKLSGHVFCIARIIDAKEADFAVVDIADLEQALHRFGKLDRIDVFLGRNEDFARAQQTIRAALPSGYRLVKPGTRNEENLRMLRSFEWNLRILSYIALIVGGFLVYNTISTGIVRRRAEIGALRALGASRYTTFVLFLLEAAFFGLAGAAIGLLIGWFLAKALVGVISQTVNALYAGSSPSPVSLSLPPVLQALIAGLSVALLAGWAPAREAMSVVPTEAMARGSRESAARTNVKRNLLLALLCATAAYGFSFLGPIDGRPVFGYLAAGLSVAAAALLTPAFVQFASRTAARRLGTRGGVELLLASRGLAASLHRTSVVVAALSTSIAMMASVGIMVGSFRKTVQVWLNSQLQADFYLRASAGEAGRRFPSIAPELPKKLRQVPGVAAVDSFTAIELTYGGLKATLGVADMDIRRRYAPRSFVHGDADAILRSLPGADRAIVSESFANKHAVHIGDRLTLQVGEKTFVPTVVGIYYDYSSESGYVILDRATFKRYLPDPAPTSLGIYLKPGADSSDARKQIERVSAVYPVSIAPNEMLRREAMKIFDRTFAVTWALEIVAILVAILGAANALLAMVLDRRREFGLLLYLGASSRQIRGLILAEAGLIGLFSLALGATLGMVLCGLLIYVINKQSFGWTIQFHAPALWLGGAMLMVWLATVLSGLYPARIAAGLKPIEVIHEE